MGEEQPRDFGRDGVSGLVNHDRALRAKLLPRRRTPDAGELPTPVRSPAAPR
ncbi:MAG: hypothetical protein QM713_15025 [Arachnia sp.]